MAEKLAEVYDKYNIEVVSTRRGRGATILTTTDGLYILEPFRGSVSRLEQEYVLKGLFQKEGFLDLDALILNQEGELITYDRYHQPFVLKRHFAGEECDMRNLSDVVRAVEKLAEFHYHGQNVAACFREEWENVKQEKEQMQRKEIYQAILGGEEPEQIARIYGMTPAAVRELVKEYDQIENLKMTDESLWNVSFHEMKESQIGSGKASADLVLETFIRRNRELRKIRKFVGGVKRKNSFENLFLQTFAEYYNKGLHCEKIFAEVMEDEGVSRTIWKRHYGICHGNYNQHNVILSEKIEAIVHFEHFSRGNQLDDLYQFARKVMEKNHFDYEMLEIILNTYAKTMELSGDDYKYMYVLFSYPEKFWKIANSYYNTNKAFLSPKYVEKLKMVMEQEKEKNEMLSQYSAFHLN